MNFNNIPRGFSWMQIGRFPEKNLNPNNGNHQVGHSNKMSFENLAYYNV